MTYSGGASGSALRTASDADTRAKGNAGEDMAAAYLLEKGYSIICRNYRSRRGEIDCVVRDPDGTLVFIEVKSSTGASCGSPFFWITPAKQRTIFALARQYLAEHGLTATPCRFDAIAISRGKLEHLRNAFIGM